MSRTSPPTDDNALPQVDAVDRESISLPGKWWAALSCGLAVAIGIVLVIGLYGSSGLTRWGRTGLSSQYIMISPEAKRLSARYSDTDGNLLADSPGNPGLLQDPDALVMSYYDGDYDDQPRVHWEGLGKQLAAATGKRVELVRFTNTAEEIRTISRGEIHIVAVHGADVPHLVNEAGFVPIAVLGTESGVSGNHLNLAVASGSDIRQLEQLRGKQLVCTRPDSITGCRAALTVLWHEAGLLPSVDYQVQYSHGQKHSIRGLVDGMFEVAAISGDKLDSRIERRDSEGGSFRLIYESPVIPRRTIGYVHTLEPHLAQRLADAILSFENADADAAADGRSLRFFETNYQRDFEFVRRIHDCCDARYAHPTH